MREDRRYCRAVRRAVLLALVVGVTACGGEIAALELPEPLPASALPELSHRDRDLPRDDLAEDSFAPDELHQLLASADYLGGREREFTGHTDTFDRVVARTLRFDSTAGAEQYVAWVASHTRELAGPTRAPEVLPVGEGGLLFELEPCPTCKKQLPTMLAAWRRDGAVGYLLAAGREVDRESLTRLARLVDRSVDG